MSLNNLQNPVIKMSAYMSIKLARNSHKNGWSGHPSKMFLRRISDELGELKRAIDKKLPPEKIWEEAADVANFAMMVAECYEGGAEYE